MEEKQDLFAEFRITEEVDKLLDFDEGVESRIYEMCKRYVEEEYEVAELDLGVTKAIVFIPVSKNEK